MPEGAKIKGVKTPDERGMIGAWAYDARLAADLSVEQAVIALLRDEHLVVHPATIRGIESGAKKPGRTLLRALGKVYGTVPPSAEAPAADGDLIAAMVAQTVAITALVEEMRMARERNEDVAAAILKAAEALGPLPRHGGSGASTERDALPDSAR